MECCRYLGAAKVGPALIVEAALGIGQEQQAADEPTRPDGRRRDEDEHDKLRARESKGELVRATAHLSEHLSAKRKEWRGVGGSREGLRTAELPAVSLMMRMFSTKKGM